MKRAVR